MKKIPVPGRVCHMRKRNQLPFIYVILLDVLVAGIILCVFALFHHALPAYLNRKAADEAAKAAPPVVSQAPVTPVPSTVPVIEESEDEPEPLEEVDPRTEWQIKFADKFTDEVIVTDTSYSSPNVSISIERVETVLEGQSEWWPVIYYIADVYIASLDNIVTYTANNRMVYYEDQDPAEMDIAADAVFSVNGDFFSRQIAGLIVRNNEVYLGDSTGNEICVLFNDGAMETYRANEYNIDELMARGVYQSWSFGPVLLDDEGNSIARFNKNRIVNLKDNPRTAIGYYEPGHYCFLVVEGRLRGTKGMSLQSMSKLFNELGCKCAYNLDGGGSSVMIYQHEFVNRLSNGDRKLSDIISIVDNPG